MQSKFKVTVVVSCIVVVFFVCFGWEQSKTYLVQDKVTKFLQDGLQGMVINAPRVSMNTDTGEILYYVPDTNNPRNDSYTSYAVYTRLLYDLNHDTSSPMIKVTNVSLDSDMTRVIDATATVEFELFPGFEKEMIVQTSILEPHFRDSTGMDLMNGKTYPST